MENNVFSFADTFWLQLSRTAMGKPTACAYTMLSYGHHENTEILEEFLPNLLYYKRYIDDIFWSTRGIASRKNWIAGATLNG